MAKKIKRDSKKAVKYARGNKKDLTIRDLTWDLKEGSHGFPGPDGGTCINEAAIVARGFEYRQVKGVADLPPCFSRVIGGFALHLNDAMGDDQRNRLLMPFVVRLAGTKDKKASESDRGKYIVQELFRIMFREEFGPTFDKYHIYEEPSLMAFLNRELDASSSYQDVLKSISKWKKRETTSVDWSQITHRQLMKLDPHLFVYGARELIEEAQGAEEEYYPSGWIETLIGNGYGKELVQILDKAIMMGKHETISSFRLVQERFDAYKEGRVSTVTGRVVPR